jgi:hypothetical protein
MQTNNEEKRLAWASLLIQALVALTEADQLQWGAGSVPEDVVLSLRLCDYLTPSDAFLDVRGDPENEQAAVNVSAWELPVLRILAAAILEQFARAVGKDVSEPERTLLEEYRRSGHIFPGGVPVPDRGTLQ